MHNQRVGNEEPDELAFAFLEQWLADDEKSPPPSSKTPPAPNHQNADLTVREIERLVHFNRHLFSRAKSKEE